jgi:ABC-type sugar transport system permease subunit
MLFVCVFFSLITGVIWNFLLAVTTGEINKILSGFSFLFRKATPQDFPALSYTVKKVCCPGQGEFGR